MTGAVQRTHTQQTSPVDWPTLRDQSVITLGQQREIIDKWRGEERGGFSLGVRFFDFESYGKPFTQVAIVLTPDRPLLIDGRPIVIAASEGGNDNGRDFIRDLRGNEGIGSWLARRGVTFIALCRLGRWNFLTDKPLGSWIDIPLDQRMPIFHRGQKRHWTPDDYEVVGAEGVSSPTGSLACRVPRAGSALERHMMALTPLSILNGFALAFDACVDPALRRDALTFYWGFSTGGAYMWAFAKRKPPTGVLGYGMTGIPLTRYSIAAAGGNFAWPYDRSTFRVRERGLPDFQFYNRGLSPEERDRQYAAALNSPRFKSSEDTFMFFNVAALSEALAKLWNAPFLPEETRQRGFAALFRENFDLMFPDSSLGDVAALDLYGIEDEVRLTAKAPEAIGAATRPYCRRYTIALLEGQHHCIDSDHAEAFGSLWLDAVSAGYFDRKN
jgi:hypothetical protein